jgi:hypothetical protein
MRLIFLMTVIVVAVVASEAARMERWKLESDQGIPLTTLVRFEFESGRVLEVPFGYLWARRVYASRLRETNKTDAITFSFWFPDGAPSITDTLIFPEFFRSEPERLQSSGDQFIVRVSTAAWDDDNKEIRPQTLMDNILSRYDRQETTAMSDGLTAYKVRDNAYGREAVYYFKSDADSQVLIDCSKFARSGDDASLCQLDSYQSSDGFRMSAGIPRDKVSEWKLIADSSAKLMRSWVK